MKEPIALIASPQCKQNGSLWKPWFYLPHFLQKFGDVLEQYELWATDGTAEVIHQFAPKLSVRLLGANLRGIVRLASHLVKKEINRVLFFQDPEDVQSYQPHNDAMLRNCNLSGGKLCINYAAYLWAKHEQQKSQPSYQEQLSANIRKQTLALIAHNEEKPKMALFVLHHRQILKKNLKVMGTAGTVEYIQHFLHSILGEQEELSIDVAGGILPSTGRGPKGGDVIVADAIFERLCQHLIFYVDHSRAHPHEADIQVLLRACTEPDIKVNLMFNSNSATEWIERYQQK